MGYAQDHINAVVRRQAKKLIAGENEQSIRKYLAECYWKPHEIDYIVRLAKRQANATN